MLNLTAINMFNKLLSLTTLDYLYAQGKDGWEGNDDEPLEGFPWGSTAAKHPKGIRVWNEVFKMRKPNGEEFGILLMYTQQHFGLFDFMPTTHMNSNATILAFSTIISSVQIYSLQNDIREDDLQKLEMLIEYGRVAVENYSWTPIQKLQLLVRDWRYQYDHAWGSDGGEELMNRRLIVSSQEFGHAHVSNKHTLRRL